MATDRPGKRRGVSVTRLRRWLAAGVITLLLALAGVLGYARYKARRFLADLTGKLGINIRRETNSFTYSQTVKGHTLYTLHAAKAIQRDNGKTTLHDVAITIYGPVGSHRTDTVKGAEFEYDQPNGVIRATGEVHLDLASPSEAAAARPGAKRIAVTTSGLIFLQKLGVAATDQPMQFTYGDMHGSATGADYETDTGLLRLRSNVTADGTEDGRTVHIRSTASEIDRNTQIATLHFAHVQVGDIATAGNTVLLTMAKDGGIQMVDAHGNAALETPEGVSATAPHMHAHMTAEGKLDLVAMAGGVHLQQTATTGTATTGLATTGLATTGTATTATLHFTPAGLPLQAVLEGNVKIDQSALDGRRSVLTAARFVADLTQDAAAHTQLQQAVATGSAVVRSVSPKPAAAGKAVMQTTVVRGDTLHAITGTANAKRYIASIDGTGSTRVEEDDGMGNIRISSGDILEARFSPPQVHATSNRALANAGTRSGDPMQSALQTAVQTGHVVVTQHTAPVSGKPAQDSRATATREEFDRSTGRLVLTGSPQVAAQGLQIAADRITMSQVDGYANATGAVSGSYLQANSNDSPGDPVHVLADRASVTRSGAVTTFYGGTRPARMWTSNGQIDAPIIETDRAGGRLLAHGSESSDRVHLLLPQSTSTGLKPFAEPHGKGAAMVHITGGTLLYTPAEEVHPAHVDISGGVRSEESGSLLTSANALVTLGAGGKQEGMLAERVESLLATGAVRLQQPGRTAAGDRLLYTAADDRYELTGTPAVPPHVADSLHGNITGAQLVFHSDDDNVEVTGEPGRRVHTETQAGRSTRVR